MAKQHTPIHASSRPMSPWSCTLAAAAIAFSSSPAWTAPRSANMSPDLEKQVKKYPKSPALKDVIVQFSSPNVDIGKVANVGKVKERLAGASSTLQQSLGKALKRDRKADGGGEPKPTHGDGAGAMTREQALRTLGLRADASEGEIDAALAKQAKHRTGLNGSDHAIAARIDAARDILRGKEGS